MRLPPIPRAALADTARVEVCSRTDLYGEADSEVFTLSNVLVQAGRGDRRLGRDVVRNRQGSELFTNAVLFVDARRSKPYVDLGEAFSRCHAMGGVMRVFVGDRAYTAVSCEAAGDGRGGIHHWEIGLR